MRVEKVSAFVIHLERAADRRPQVDRLLAELPLPGEVLAAVDGRTLAEADRQRHYRRLLHVPRYPFGLSDGEIACFLSHRAAWQAILDRGLDGGLIVEDDVATDGGRFAETLEAVMRHAQAGDYIRFPRRERGEAGPVVYDAAPATVIEPNLPALGALMQLVGQEAARALLDATTAFDRPIDSLVQMQWLHRARVLSARPVVIREISAELGGTVLQNKRMRPLQRASHELRRPLLRLAVKRHNRRWRSR